MCLPISKGNNVCILLLVLYLLYTSIIFTYHFIAWYSAISVNTHTQRHACALIYNACERWMHFQYIPQFPRKICHKTFSGYLKFGTLTRPETHIYIPKFITRAKKGCNYSIYPIIRGKYIQRHSADI